MTVLKFQKEVAYFKSLWLYEDEDLNTLDSVTIHIYQHMHIRELGVTL
jgi:hypothetical protein